MKIRKNVSHSWAKKIIVKIAYNKWIKRNKNKMQVINSWWNDKKIQIKWNNWLNDHDLIRVKIA